MGPGRRSQARNDAAFARMAHRDRSSLEGRARGSWARHRAPAPTRHLDGVCQYVCLAGCRGDLGGARSRDCALPPGRPRCGPCARLYVSATCGRAGEHLSEDNTRDAVVVALVTMSTESPEMSPAIWKMTLEDSIKRLMLGFLFPLRITPFYCDHKT